MDTKRIEKIDLFSANSPCIVPKFRQMTEEDMRSGKYTVQDALKGIVVGELARYDSPESAAIGVVQGQNGNYISSHSEKCAKKQVPKNRKLFSARTPDALVVRRNKYPQRDDNAVDAAIKGEGGVLSQGQVLYHGGSLPDGDNQISRPLSTSLSPTVAYNDAIRHLDLYTDKKIRLYVLKAVDDSVPAYLYESKRSGLGHELEVLIGSGVHVKDKKVVCSAIESLCVDCMTGEKEDFTVEVVSATLTA